MRYTSVVRRSKVTQALEEVLKGRGLSPGKLATLRDSGDAEWKETFKTAASLTRKVFQRKLHFFAPLYFSNYCVNDCAYCGFRRSNGMLERRFLNPEEFLSEANYLWRAGHRTLLLLSGEHPSYSNSDIIAEYLWGLKRQKMDFRLVLEVGPLETSDYRFLRSLGIRQCLIFQETYDPETYTKVHAGLKRDFEWRLGAMERALEGGMERVGLGILVGLHDWEEDLKDLFAHAKRLKKISPSAPATFSFPRIRPAPGVEFKAEKDFIVSDKTYEKILALARLAFPETGIVLSTREEPRFRDLLLKKGHSVTHLSAGSVTGPGGYILEPDRVHQQFQISDKRRLSEMSRRVRALGYQALYN